MRRIESVRATPADYTLAEGPVWDEREQRLVWVDIAAGAIVVGELAGDAVRELRRIELGGYVGAVALAEDGGLIAAVDAGLAAIAADGTVRRSGRLLPDGLPRRMNDGQCDPAGRFLVGSLAFGVRGEDEVLIRVDADGAVDTIRTGLGLSNGIGWSPDGGTIYHIDTFADALFSASYSPETGECGAFAPLIAFEGEGSPDGLAVDADGGIWVAVWGAGEIRRFAPDGRLDAVVAVDAPQTSSVAFAGPGLDRLVITTAHDGLSGAALLAAPASGSLFLADPGVVGLPARRWAGSTSVPRWPS